MQMATRDMLINFYKSYPDNLLGVYGTRRTDIAPHLLASLTDYRDIQLHNLSQAQLFKLDDEAEIMLGGLMNEISSEGLEDTFQNVKLPFSSMLIEKLSPFSGLRGVGLLTQIDTAIEAQFYAFNNDILMPNLATISTNTFPFTVISSPTAILASSIESINNLDEGMVQDRTNALSFLSMGVGMATLLKYKGMLDVEEVPAYSRAERRRAEKSGRPLPDLRISKISLGEAGKGQLEATRQDQDQEKAVHGKRRAHWVRGHWMRTSSGALSFRNPHVRGVGPVIRQERFVRE